jgi:hypothetical protein
MLVVIQCHDHAHFLKLETVLKCVVGGYQRRSGSLMCDTVLKFGVNRL